MDRYSTVVCSPTWHKGVIGIVASRLMETTAGYCKALSHCQCYRSVRDFDCGGARTML
jgi:single-stranded DNA-specific DHH superfamily exonuclease